jgi:hypothetical protein
MPQATLEKAVVQAVARKFDETVLAAAVDRALELLKEESQTTNERRKTIAEALRAVRNEEARLVDAVKHGETLDALLTALHSAQERRQTLEGQLARIDAGTLQRLADPEQIRAKLLARAADIRGVLAQRESETRRVLQAVFAERIAFAPFNEGDMRGYQFVGTGSYGDVLLGDTCPTSNGGPNGIRSWDCFLLTFSFEAVALASYYNVAAGGIKSGACNHRHRTL